MSIHAILDNILIMDRLSIPKRETDQRVKEIFGDLVEEHGDTWRVKCCHRCNPGASDAAIRETERALGFALPEELRCFLRLANGAELFVVHRLGLQAELPGTFHVRYKIFGTEELITLNKELLRTFRRALGRDPEFHQIECLNYVAFCDVDDGNYLAMLLETHGAVFFLHRELRYRPYSEQDDDMYYSLGDSLEQWLTLLRDTGGWAGRGMMIGGF